MQFLCILPIAFFPAMWYNKYSEREVVNAMKEIKIHNKELQFEERMNKIVSTCFKAINVFLITFIISIIYTLAFNAITKELTFFGMGAMIGSVAFISVAIIIANIFDKKDFSKEQEKKYKKWLI